MGVPYFEVAREPYAQGMDLNGNRFMVYRVKHNQQIAGVSSDTTFTVDTKQGTYGFGSEQDVMNFLTTAGPVTVNEHDSWGNPSEVKREGLGLPDGLIKKLKEDTAPTATANTGGEHFQTGAVEDTSKTQTDTPPTRVSQFPQSQASVGSTGPTGNTGSTGSKKDK